MSNSKPSTDETQVLPLHKFAPGAPAPSGPEGMTLFIKRAAEETVQESGEALVLPQGTGSMPPATLLGAVTYCYASDVYESDRIERKLAADPQLKAAIGEQVPAAGAIRRFRRLNRSLILETLERAFLKFRSAKVEKPQEDPASTARSQAEQKLQLASLLDRSH